MKSTLELTGNFVIAAFTWRDNWRTRVDSTYARAHMWRRVGCGLIVVLMAGCNAAQLPAAQATVALTAVPTVAPAATVAPTPTVAPEPTSAPTPVATATVVAEQVAASTSDTEPVAVDQSSPDPATCDGTNRPDPLPAPGTARSQDFFRSFRTPLPAALLWDPPGQKRVGLQAGHWMNEDVPPELGRLQGGSSGGGKQEWQVNLDIAQRTAALLEAAGVQVDVLPATVPPGYRANVFVALHADGDPAGAAHGFKVARPGFSSLPDVDDRLVETMNQVYGADTELPRDDEHISLRMRYYYAFNSRRYCHAVAPGVPQAIVEMGYLTSAGDRQFLIGDPDKLAHGLADSIQTFLSSLP
jgi:N-acetylmuramoyl-L-alanine amidase